MSELDVLDYIVVKDYETAEDLTHKYKGKDLVGKWVIVAPKGLKSVSKEEIAHLPQVKALLIAQRKKLIKEIENIDIKKHICRFNDGKQNCACYCDAIDDVLKEIKDLMVGHDFDIEYLADFAVLSDEAKEDDSTVR